MYRTEINSTTGHIVAKERVQNDTDRFFDISISFGKVTELRVYEGFHGIAYTEDVTDVIFDTELTVYATTENIAKVHRFIQRYIKIDRQRMQEQAEQDQVQEQAAYPYI